MLDGWWRVATTSCWRLPSEPAAAAAFSHCKFWSALFVMVCIILARLSSSLAFYPSI